VAVRARLNRKTQTAPTAVRGGSPRKWVALASVDGSTLRVEVDRRRPTARRLLSGLLEMSYVDLADPTHLEFEYMRRVGDVIDVAWPVPDALAAVHLGGAACTLARYLAARRPGSRSEVYEHDLQVLEIAERELGLRTSRALRVRVGDARALLARRASASADLVVGDAFSGADVPPALLTVEFVQDVRRVLRPGGIYVLNVIDAPPLRLARRQAAALGGAFAELAIAATPKLLHGRASGNIVLIASDRPLPESALRDRAAREVRPEELLCGEDARGFARAVRPLTDADLAPGSR
jgi:spermidine synthase